MNQDGVFRRRHLPHWDVEGKPFFITARLDGSISSAGMDRIRQSRLELDDRPRPENFSEPEWERYKDKLLFALVDELLDHQSPVKHLADDRQAEIVQNALLHFPGERYSLLAFVSDAQPSSLAVSSQRRLVETGTSKISKGRCTPQDAARNHLAQHQSYTATMCNRARGESGSYWQTETFDHWARDEAEMFRIIDYIEQNPVKAHLADRPEDWPWSSARLRAIAGTKPGDPILKPVG